MTDTEKNTRKENRKTAKRSCASAYPCPNSVNANILKRIEMKTTFIVVFQDDDDDDNEHRRRKKKPNENVRKSTNMQRMRL